MKRTKPRWMAQTQQINAIYRRGFHHRVLLNGDILSRQIQLGGRWVSTEWLEQDRNAFRGVDFEIQTLHLANSSVLDLGYFFKDENLAFDFKMRWG